MTRERREALILGAATGAAAGFLARDLDLTTLASFWGDRLVPVPAGLVIGLLCANTRLRQPLQWATLALAFLWVAVAYGPVSRWMLPGLVRSDTLRPADAVLVLSSSVQKDGDPSSVQLARLYRGLELVRDGYAPRLMVTELPKPWGQQRAFVETMLKRFRPETELIVFESVRNTHDEALAAIAYLRARGLKSVIVTSSPTHTFRAGGLFEKEGVDVMTAPAIETRFDLQTFGRADERLGAFGSLLHEQVGIVVYRMRGWIP